MKKIPKIIIETGVMAGSLGLVLITLSGDTRRKALSSALVVLVCAVLSQCSDRYRYPCDNPANAGTAECQGTDVAPTP